MRNARVFRALLGVEKTVIEAVEFDEAGELLLARACGRHGAPKTDVGCVSVAVDVTTQVKAGAAGELWTRAR